MKIKMLLKTKKLIIKMENNVLTLTFKNMLKPVFSHTKEKMKMFKKKMSHLRIHSVLYLVTSSISYEIISMVVNSN